MAGTIGSLARAILAADARAISPEAIRQAKLLLLDTIGCGLAGTREEVTRSVIELAVRGGPPECALIGTPAKTDVLNAVLANGVAIRVLDLNDYLINLWKGTPETGGHPSDNIPVALAVGASRACSGAEILAAIVIGYELYARLQLLMDRGGHWDGVTVSGLVAPAIAGRLMGLDERRLAHALALGLARAATPAIVRRGDISAAKSIANATVAQSGVLAALLAEKSVTGPLAILDDEHGLRDLFRDAKMSRLTEPFLPAKAVMRAHVKTFPCVNTGQSAVAAALKLHKVLRNSNERLSRIEVSMADYPAIWRQQTDEGRIWPQSREAADHSFPFIVAVSLIDGAFDRAQYANERWRDPHVVRLMSKIVMRRDAEWNTRSPDAFPCAIRAWDSAGRKYLVEASYPPGFSKDGLEESVVIEKFHAVAEPAIDRAARERIVEAAIQFDQSPSTATLDAAIAIGETIT